MGGVRVQVIIGVDPHELSAAIEVLDGRERILGSGRFSTDKGWLSSDARLHLRLG